jgi:hypothetical protein
MHKPKVTADKDRNRLNFTLCGIITKKNLSELYTEVRFCVPDLQAGFDVFSDLSGCTLAFLNIIPTFKNIMNYLLSNGAGEMVCIMTDNTIIYKQIQLATIFQGYKPSFVSTLEEAEEHLATSKRRSELRFFLHQQPVHYASSDGKKKAQLLNISINGCAITSAAPHVSVGEELSITLPLLNQKDSADPSEILSEVVRVEDNSFAVRFIDLSANRKKLLWDLLILESQQEKKYSNKQLQSEQST